MRRIAIRCIRFLLRIVFVEATCCLLLIPLLVIVIVRNRLGNWILRLVMVVVVLGRLQLAFDRRVIVEIGADLGLA